MALKPRPIVADADSFRLLRDDVGIGEIRELSPDDASLVAHHLGTHAETFYLAASGVALDTYPSTFRKGQQALAIEWVRREPHPQEDEPELNTNRFLFGLTPDEKHCFGYDVTEKRPNVSKEQVFNHWTTLEELIARLPPASKPGTDSE